MSKESWKYIEGFPDYMISDRGRVKSFKGNNEKMLKPMTNRYGYLRIMLYQNKRNYRYFVHRLVANHFISPPKDGQQINHENGIKTDNRVKNLKWCTKSENQRHAYSIGLESKKGEKHSQHKLIKDQVIEIRKRYKEGGILQKELAKEYGVTQSAISDIINNKRWNHLK